MNENQFNIFILKKTTFYPVTLRHCSSVTEGPEMYEAI